MALVEVGVCLTVFSGNREVGRAGSIRILLHSTLLPILMNKNPPPQMEWIVGVVAVTRRKAG